MKYCEIQTYQNSGQGYWMQGGVAETLRTVPASQWENLVCYAVENHPNDSRVSIDPQGIVQTLSARIGTGGVIHHTYLLPVCVLVSTSRNAEVTDGSISPTLLNRAGTGGNQLPIAVLKRIEA